MTKFSISSGLKSNLARKVGTSPDHAQVLVTKRRKRRPECVAPRETRKRNLCSILRRPTEWMQSVRNARRMISALQ